MRRQLIILLIGSVLCSGCTSDRFLYTPNKSVSQQETDIRECKAEAKRLGNVPYDTENDPFFTDNPDQSFVYRGGAPKKVDEIYRKCLEQRGYVLYDTEEIARRKVHVLDDTDESWRKIDPTLGIEVPVRSNPPGVPLSNANFDGSSEKEFILYGLEAATCDVSFMGSCIWYGRSTWKRVAVVSNRGGELTAQGKVDCPGKVILTGWYKKESQHMITWVQAKTDIVSYIADKPALENKKPVGVVAGFADGSGGYGKVEFIFGCNP